MRRRQFLIAPVAGGLFGRTLEALSEEPAPVDRITFQVRETAGIRRYGYPVSIILPLDAEARQCRLFRGAQEIPAQFRSEGGRAGRAIVLDFNASPGPLEVEDYVVKAGQPPARDGRGLRLARGTGDGLLGIENPPYITSSVPEDAAGLLRSVRTPDLEFLNGSSPGLVVGIAGKSIELAGGKYQAWQARPIEVDREGPLAIGLVSRATIRLGDGREAASELRSTFPSSKSWMEVDWTVHDPARRIESLGFGLDLQLEGLPILIDAGAGSSVYTTLGGSERFCYESGPGLEVAGRRSRWLIRHGKGDVLPIEAADPRTSPSGLEGWVHIMDRKRCTALAVAEFGASSRRILDRIEVDADGRLRLTRRFVGAGIDSRPEDAGTKSLHFWLHFVSMPVQVGAKTSPQAMLAPLEVMVGRKQK